LKLLIEYYKSPDQQSGDFVYLTEQFSHAKNFHQQRRMAMTTLAEADVAVAVMLEARDDAIFELLYNDGDIDALREADQAFSFAIDVWGRLDDAAKAQAAKEKADIGEEAASESPTN
jgi:hypothetical protein